MIEIIIALLMSMGLSTDFTFINVGSGTPPNDPDGLGSTANGTCVVKLNDGDTYILISDSKGNYRLEKM